jgi:hypothetical protein
MARCRSIAVLLIAAFALAGPGQAVPKDQSRLLSEPDGSPPAAPTEPLPDATLNTDDAPEEPEDLSLGEIPDIKTVELTVDVARRALDTYIMVKAKYADTDLESYDNLQDFVDQAPQGKAFDADLRAAGFAGPEEWNVAITALGFAYTGITDDPTADINQQIGEIEGDATIAQDLKDRMVASLKAMIPTDNNRKVVGELMQDPAYAEKLKQLDIEEE